MVVGRPLRVVDVVPHALQVTGQLRVLAGRTQREIAAVLEQHGLELTALGRGRGLIAIRGEQVVGGALGHHAVKAQVEVHAVHERGEVLDVVGTDGVVAARHGVVRRLLHARQELGIGFTGAIDRIIIPEIRRRCNVERKVVGTRDHELVALGLHVAAVCHHLEHGSVLELVILHRTGHGDLVARCADLGARLLGREGDLDVDACLAARLETAYDDLVGMAGEELARDVPAGRIELDARDTGRKIQRALVIGRGAIAQVGVLQVDVAPGLIGAVAFLVTDELVAHIGGLGVLALGEELLDALDRSAVGTLRDVVAAVVVLAGITRTTGPQRLLIKGEVLGLHLAVHVRAHVAVADGQRALLPHIARCIAGGRRGFVIAKPQGVADGHGIHRDVGRVGIARRCPTDTRKRHGRR